MEKVDIDDVEQAALSGPVDRRDVGRALGATDVAVMYYELDPGEKFSGGYHTHLDQEELFLVLEGAAEFKTEQGTVTVTAGEAIRFAPGEFQTGYNHRDSEEPLRGLALGAPAGMDETVSIFQCPDCGEEGEHDVALDETGGTVTTTCRNCGFEMETEP
jgi:uncharacterized cupin superfamily protein